MLHLYENSVVDELRKMAIMFRGTFSEDRGAAKLELNNEHGKGTICTYAIRKGLSARTYNITFNHDFEFKKDDSLIDPLCLINCLEGYYLHKFENEQKFTKINPLESTLIRTDTNQKNIVVIPKNTPIKLSVIFISRPEFEEDKSIDQSFLKDTIDELTDYRITEVPFRYSLKANIDAVSYLELLINTTATDLTTRLLVQSSILKVIAIQLNKLDQISENKSKTNKGLNSTELNKILNLASSLESNLTEKITIEKLALKVSLSPAKLQMGFKRLFGTTVNEYIREVRLEKARSLIETTDMNISEICYALGSTNRSYFSKSFYERYKISPSDYAKQLRNSGNMVFEISYNSKASGSLTDKDIEEMILKAREKNIKNNITGCLVYKENAFYQIFEGSMGAVIDLYNQIKKDPRHSDITVMNKSWRTTRGYTNWDMAFFSDKFKNLEPLEGKKLNFLKTSLINIDNKIETGSEEYWSYINNLLRSSKN